MPALKNKRDCGMLKHLQLASALRKDIVRGRLKAGDKVRSVRELAEHYQTTKATVAQAMDQLAREGLIERQHGRGNFVSPARARTLAVVFDHQIADPNATVYCSRLLAEVEKALGGTNWTRKSYVDVSCRQSAEEFLRAVAERRFDGVIVASRWVAEHGLDPLFGAGIRCIGAFPYPTLDRWVFFDYGESSRLGVAALAGIGARRVALIAGQDPLGMDRDMWDGYCRGLQEARIPLDHSLVQIVPVAEPDGFHALNELWRRPLRPDGIVVTDELVAKGVVRGIIARGIRVPKQLYIASQVTAVAENPFALPVVQLQTDVAEQAATLVKAMIEQPADQSPRPWKVLLPPRIHNPFERKVK